MNNSPFFALYDIDQTKSKLSLINSHFSNFFNNILFSSIKTNDIYIKNTVFSRILNNAIFLKNAELTGECFFVNSDGTQYSPGQEIENQNITSDQYTSNDNQRPFFTGTCGDITITDCIFDGCHAETYYSGSLYIEQECTVNITSTIFKNSYTGRQFGGAAVILKKMNNLDGINFNDEPIKSLNISYCCFYKCYGKMGDAYYGIAVFA